MEERACLHCGLTSAVNDEGKCPLCGGDANAVPEPTAPETEATPATVPGEPVPAVTEMKPPAVPPAPPPPPAVPPAVPPVPPPPMPTPTAELADGQTRCPHCGEAIYSGEQTCWSCGKSVDAPLAESAPAPAAAPPPVAAGLLPPALEPVTAAPEAAPALGWDELPRAEDKPAPSAEAMRLSYWSLGLTLAALLTCGVLSILAPIGLWLGMKARREGGDTVATVGFVLGIIGTLVFVIVVIAVALVVIGATVGATQSFAPLSTWPA